MDTRNLVVARYLDGRTLKGVTHDFTALRPSLHIEIEDSHEILEVRMRQLKALFFVKSFDGFPERTDVRGFIEGPHENAQGRKIAVRFRDGELMCGYTMSWTPDREGFFMFPADDGSNNDRVYVVTAATAEVKAGPAAEALAQRMLNAQAPAKTPPGTAQPASPQGPRIAPTTLGPRAANKPRSDAA